MRKTIALLMLATLAAGSALPPGTASAAKAKIISVPGLGEVQAGKSRKRGRATGSLPGVPNGRDVPPPPPRTLAKSLMGKGTLQACLELQDKVALLERAMTVKEIRAVLGRRPDWTLLRNDRSETDGEWRAGDFESALLVYYAGGHPLVISLDRSQRLQFVNGSSAGWAEQMREWRYCSAAYDAAQLPIDRVACPLHPKRAHCN